MLDSAERVSVALEKQELRNRLRDAGIDPRERNRRRLRFPLRLGRVGRLAWFIAPSQR